jgi:hypothetical protein
MMERQAIDIALDMLGRPLLIREFQRAPLPPGVRQLIHIAAGSEIALAEAGKGRGRDPNTLREAAILFLQQALFQPGADSHRVLGLVPGATAEDIREHRRLLLKWLHPDRNPSSWEQRLFQRVIIAAADLEKRLASPSPKSSITTSVAQRQRTHRSRSHRRSIVRRRQPLQWRARFRIYLRRTAIAAILLSVGSGAWRLITGKPISLVLVGLPDMTMGLLPW